MFCLAFYALFAQKSKKRGETPGKSASHAASARSGRLHSSIHIFAQSYGDSIVVRWAPGTSSLWLLSQKNGYRLRRRVFRRDPDNRYILIDSGSIAIRPWSLDRWGNCFQTTRDSLAAVGAQIAYGKTLDFNNDNAGNLNSLMDKHNEQESRYGFALLLSDFDPIVATGMGFRFVENNVNRNGYYLYDVLSLADTATIKTDTAITLVQASMIRQRDSFPAVRAIAGDRQVKLYWDRGIGPRRFSGYVMERSEDGKTFARLNRLPFVPLKDPKKRNAPAEFSDSVALNYHDYYYRVAGIDAFGDRSNFSKPIKIRAIDLTPPHAPLITEIKNLPGTSAIRLRWAKREKENDFKGYVVGRSTSLKGPYEPLIKDFLPFAVDSFIDRHADPNAANYYIVAAVDSAGNAGRSMPAYMNVDDHQPPAKPMGLKGSVDTTGHVTLTWRWGREPDLLGYKVYFANAPGHAFAPLCTLPLTDTVFRDSITLRTLSRKIYYEVVAYDRSNNASPASDVLVVTKPDKVPPVAAMIKNFSVSDTGVRIGWFRSSSADAARQIVWRQDGNTSWISLDSLGRGDTSFTDRKVRPGHRYSYAIETVDSSRLSSGRSFPLNVYVYATAAGNGIANFVGKPDPGGNGCLLAWTAPYRPVHHYVLFRGKDNLGLKMTADIPGDSVSWSDKPGTGNFQYAIKAYYRDGGGSALSEIKSIDLP